jgi:uncharacterized protein
MIHNTEEEFRESNTLSFLLNQSMGWVSAELLDSKFPAWKCLNDLGGATPLHCAAYYDRPEISTLLLENGAAIERIDEHHRTALLLAVERNSHKTTNILLDHGAHVNYQGLGGYTSLMIAVQYGFEDLAELLIHRNACLDLYTLNGLNLLHLAVFGKSLKLFRLFLDRGIDPYHRDAFGVSLVSLALEPGSNFISFVLHSRLLAGVSKSSPNLLRQAIISKTQTPLSFIFKSLPNALALEQLNAHVDGLTSPLCAAARLPSKRSVTKLLELGADMEIEGSEDGTALTAACASGRLEIVELLVRRGARVQYVNEHGISRSAVAAARHHPNIQKWLLSSRFHSQAILTSTAFSLDHELKPWSGPQIFEYKLEKVEMQFLGESMIDYVTYVLRLKKRLLGRVVGV